jgi:hypothetical protein
MTTPIPPMSTFEFWHRTILSMPPMGVWFMGRYAGAEVMPTYLFPGICISCRVVENEMKVIQHPALPPEWRP